MGKLAKILGSISPFAGMVTGQGAFGKGLAAMGDIMGPMSGIAPRVAKSARDKRAEEQAAEQALMEKALAEQVMAERMSRAAPAMKRGGKVKKMASGGVAKSSASKRGDGCAMRGKTRGKMV